MSKAATQNLTEQQRKWFVAVRDGLERETGKSLGQWVAIAKECPETGTRARLKWFKDTHGLLQNRAMHVLSEAFPPPIGWDTPEALQSALWKDPASLQILNAVNKMCLELPEVIATQRKGFSAWSRRYQFAALRPLKGGTARLGLALTPAADERLRPAKNEGWSERLQAAMEIESPRDANRRLAALLRQAWTAS